MTGRRRVVLLALLALAAPLPALALDRGALDPMSAAAGPVAIDVSASLDSCGVLEDGVVCEINVSFGAVPNADTYSAAVTRADGSVIDYGSVAPGGTSLWVPYVGSGSYSVRITAYGEPETPAEERDGRGDVIASGYSEGDEGAADTKPETANEAAEELDMETGVTGRDPEETGNADPDGAAATEVDASEPATDPTCTAPPAEPAPAAPTPPAEPPEDLDPDNPDEDLDGIPDEQERITYEQQLAEYQAALAAQAQTPAPAPGC